MKRTAYMMMAAILLFGIGLQTQGQEKRMAVVEQSAIYMRQQPDYESALETQELMGTVVEIVGEKRYWREIVSPQPYRAWTTEKGLVEMTPKQLEEYERAPKVMYMEEHGHIYMEPSSDAAFICDLTGGDIMRTALESGRCKPKKKGKWTQVMLPSGRTGYVPSVEIKAHEGFISIKEGESVEGGIGPETTEAIIVQAHKMLGSPYLWGGMSSIGTDCSGLVRLCYLMNGILLPRNASQQFKCGKHVPMEIDIRYWEEKFRTTEEAGRHPDAFRQEMLQRTSGLKRGDLIFFGSPPTETGGKPRVTHVGIYLGEGKMIHSSQVVRINSLIPGETDYYENSHRLVGAVRI